MAVATLPSISRQLVHYTRAELEALDLPDDGVRYELVHGELLVSPLGNVPHQGIALRLALRLVAYTEKFGTGDVFSPGAVAFGDDSELQPDVLVVPSQPHSVTQWSDIKTWWLAVEVLSPSTRSKDLTVKRAAYLEFGVQQIWFVDPKTNSVTIVRHGAADTVVAAPETLTWLVPGAATPLTINLVELWSARAGSTPVALRTTIADPDPRTP